LRDVERAEDGIELGDASLGASALGWRGSELQEMFDER
jgi:hypothetical protein